MNSLNFDNRTVKELPKDPKDSPHTRPVLGAFWSAVKPKPVTSPELVAHASEVAELLGLTPEETGQADFIDIFSGNRLAHGMEPYASCYGGHQFGRWAGQLGDGRAIGLGEVVNRAGERWELQLKGSGLTPYSRGGDGLAVLRSSIREFLCSEAMHHLGIATTRALSVITTGEPVTRDMFYDGHPRHEPGAVVCRVSPSFIRFGHFEIFAKRGENKLLEQLVDFTISRDFPELAHIESTSERRQIWFTQVCERTARLMVEWLRVGFVHGVMNTDNMSILGLTIDYGPYGWIDHFDANWTPNTTDSEEHRYAYGRQPEIARWNLERLAEALSPLMESSALNAGLTRYDALYFEQFQIMLATKFGWGSWQKSDSELVERAFALLHNAEVDMTDFFRRLATVDIASADIDTLRPAFYREELFQRYRVPFSQWLASYSQRVNQGFFGKNGLSRRQSMDQVNPRFVLRNYIAQQAIERSQEGDHQLVRELLEVLKTPYDHQPEHAHWYGIRPEWARNKPGCSMLSCSS
ncbi:MAG: YdiU family protein [Magnetococcales bacterium]|nr:YdiU family protein [Magnetococcales bacterium]